MSMNAMNKHTPEANEFNGRRVLVTGGTKGGWQGDCRPFPARRGNRHHNRALRPDGKDGQPLYSGR